MLVKPQQSNDPGDKLRLFSLSCPGLQCKPTTAPSTCCNLLVLRCGCYHRPPQPLAKLRSAASTVRPESLILVYVKPANSSDQQAAHPRAQIVSSRHEYASARNQDVALRQDRIAAPEKKRKPGVKPGDGLWGNLSTSQPTYLFVLRSVVDPSLDLGGHVAI